MPKRVIAAVILALFLLSPAYSYAGDVMEGTLHDSLYGGIIGALAGAAIMAVSSNPGDHVEYIPIGGAIGVLAGTAYGFSRNVVQTSGAEDEEKAVAAERPIVDTVKVYDKRAGTTEVVSVVNVVRYGF
ncbi:MAG: hypothetical protein HY883_07375 [Deltaproteobacteria bacterium]|nr:hypothetical protein [Deltaproteobacteria bacterium]